MAGLTGYLVSQRLATLHELKTCYSLQDAMLMWEAHYVPKANEAREVKRRQEEIENKRR